MLYKTKSTALKSKLLIKENVLKQKASEDFTALLKVALIPELKSVILDEISKYLRIIKI